MPLLKNTLGGFFAPEGKSWFFKEIFTPEGLIMGHDALCPEMSLKSNLPKSMEACTLQSSSSYGPGKGPFFSDEVRQLLFPHRTQPKIFIWIFPFKIQGKKLRSLNLFALMGTTLISLIIWEKVTFMRIDHGSFLMWFTIACYYRQVLILAPNNRARSDFLIGCPAQFFYPDTSRSYLWRTIL